ncbi:hypothetical protein IAT38_006896 [Cryptococcus sp. DSM 104549]
MGSSMGTSAGSEPVPPEKALAYVKDATEYNQLLLPELASNPQINSLGSAMLRYKNTRAQRGVPLISRSRDGADEAVRAWQASSEQIDRWNLVDPPRELEECVSTVFESMEKNAEMIARLEGMMASGRGSVAGWELQALEEENMRIRNDSKTWPGDFGPLMECWEDCEKALNHLGEELVAASSLQQGSAQ